MAEWKKQEGAAMWLPENKGDELVGEVIAVHNDGDYGLNHTIKNDKGEEVLTNSHKVLQSRMKKAKVGTMVRIVYTGEEPPSVKGYSPMKMYEVYFQE